VLISVAIFIAARIRTLQMGPKVMLAAKVKMRSGLTIDAAVAHLNALERRIKEAWPEVGWCFVEPDVSD
jgi:divalent metal cation (Fe/Co/Zn/Cd) transporter